MKQKQNLDENSLRIKENTETESRILIRGGKPLNGKVKISGAKNSVLKLMAACILIPGEVILKNVAALKDVQQMLEILKFLGGKCKYNIVSETLKIDFSEINSCYAPFELVNKLRASFVILGPILSRQGSARVSLPGGCQIGSRRLNLHEIGLKKLGAELEFSHGYIEASAKEGKLKGAEIHLDIPSNGATENLMMAAVLAKGKTIIENAAKDPEIEDLANFLNECGAKITGAGTQHIEIEGVNLEELHGCEYSCMPDRIEAGTFLIAGFATKGHVIVDKVNSDHLTPLLSKLKEAGAEIDIKKNKIEIKASTEIKSIEISTLWHPGFPTDLQPLMMTLLTIAKGNSVIKETIYEDRFSQAEDLNRMGANIRVVGNMAIIEGVEELSGSIVRGKDLRATAALIIAGLMAKGMTEVYGLSHLDRGYYNLVEKLKILGAEIVRVEEE